jgi:hypothetical protein
MAWGNAGSTTLTSTGDNIAVSSLTSNTFFQTMSSIIDSAWTFHDGRLNSDTGTNYGYRYRDDASYGTDGTAAGANKILFGTGGGETQIFSVSYIANISGEEKLVITPNSVNQAVEGAGGALSRRESVSKWTGTAVINSITAYNSNTPTGGYAVDSNLTILGDNITAAAVVATKVQDGAVYYETDTNKSYVLSSSVWTEL